MRYLAKTRGQASCRQSQRTHKGPADGGEPALVGVQASRRSSTMYSTRTSSDQRVQIVAELAGGRGGRGGGGDGGDGGGDVGASDGQSMDMMESGVSDFGSHRRWTRTGNLGQKPWAQA